MEDIVGKEEIRVCNNQLPLLTPTPDKPQYYLDFKLYNIKYCMKESKQESNIVENY